MFRTIGFGGGGVKGILHIGALRELAKHQPLKFDSIYGCSVGSIIATYIAFELPMDKIPFEYLNLDKFVPKFQFQHLSSALSSKGLYPMDVFETNIREMFLKAGLDIKDKKIGDAKMPLYIVSSNITKGVPAIFSGDISLIDALKCSCCIPGMFRPHELYGQMYVDGVLFTPCIANIMPKDALALSLTKQRKRHITPSLIESMSPISYLTDLHTMSSHLFHNACLTPNTLCMAYPNLHSDSDLSEFDTSDILNHSGNLLQKFLAERIA
jgi:predicted patatin/cPLA2 family phospholipase